MTNILLLLLHLLMAQKESPQLQLTQKYTDSLLVYRSAYFIIEKPEDFNVESYRFKASNGMKVRFNETTVGFAPVDTLPFYIFLLKDHQKIDSVLFKAESNPAFNEEWRKLSFGERFTPLVTIEEVHALKNFSKYRIKNHSVPDFQLHRLDGSVLTEEDFKGKVTMLNFWFFGCRPCMAEIPALNELKRKYADNPEVEFISFFKDEIEMDSLGRLIYCDRGAGPKAKRDSMRRNVNFNFEQIPNTESINPKFNVMTYPTNMVIDKNGIIREIEVGAYVESSNDHLIRIFSEAIDELLQEE